MAAIVSFMAILIIVILVNVIVELKVKVPITKDAILLDLVVKFNFFIFNSIDYFTFLFINETIELTISFSC